MQIIQREAPSATVWVYMEASNYVDATLNIYKSALKNHPNVGICLQSYLRRTQKDLADCCRCIAASLVKGAYKEPPEIAFPRRRTLRQLLRSRAGIAARAIRWRSARAALALTM